MLEKFEQHFAQIKEKEEKPKEVSPKLYQRAIEYAKRIKEIRKKETPTEEDLKEVKRLLKKIERIFLPEKRIIGWKLEGKLTEENVLAEYKAGEGVSSVSFSPEGDKVAIGINDGYMRVVSLLEKEGDKPKVLAEYKAGGWVSSVSFSPEGDKVAIGINDGYMKVVSLLEKEDDKPKVLAEYKAGGEVSSVSFSPEGDKVAIGSYDGTMKVIGERES
jgi:WD40 repeat protein